jgi:hypothetical protein
LFQLEQAGIELVSRLRAKANKRLDLAAFHFNQVDENTATSGFPLQC